MTTVEEIKAEYTSSLADLTFNSKPLINVLTMLAEENLPNAKIIVEAIEEHLSKVSTDVKLPILYLVDCIVKNVGQTYSSLFSQNIVSTFCSVFKVVDERTRSEMFKLRQTWNDVFPQMKLYAIDVQINMIDPAWPVTAQPSNSIHLNPKFLKSTTATPKSKLPPVGIEPATNITTAKPVTADIDKETLLMQEQLIQKQKELLELQRKTLELEVLQTQVKLQEQMKAGGPPISTNILLKPEVAKQLIPEGIAKTRPTGITSSVMNQRLQNNASNQPRINPVNSALAAAKPIRDPRLLRQQQQKLLQQASQSNVSSASVPQKTAVLENNKNVTNKPGVRDIHKDPRLSNKVDKKPKTYPKSSRDPVINSDPSQDQSHILQKLDKASPRNSPQNKSDNFEQIAHISPKSSSNSGSLASSSSSSLDSPTKTKGRSPNKNKKRGDKPGSTRGSQDFGVSNKRDKIPSKIEGTAAPKGGDGTTFKTVKGLGKSRNYMKRNMSDSPVPPQDEDLRALPPPDKQPRIQQSNSTTLESSESEPLPDPVSKPMDVDLRQLPAPITKKRTSTETSDQATKKSRSFDVLFGNEDTDLRQLPVKSPERVPVLPQERPPTPPPPIISTKEQVIEKTVLPQSPKKADLDAIRAKLANATNRDKVMAKSYHKKKLQSEAMGDLDMRFSHVPPSIDVKSNIMISPEEEKVIKSGCMTKEQEKQILNKIFMQIEKGKLREAKKKDQEESVGNISLQPISDDEFDSDVEDIIDRQDRDDRSRQIPPPASFNDKDERLNLPQMSPMQSNVENVPHIQPPPQFYPRSDVRRPPFRGGAQNWRGRGRGMPSQGPPQARPPIRPWMHQQQQKWRNGPPQQQQQHFMPHPPEFGQIPLEEESSRSPGQDFGPQELTVLQEENKTLNIDGVPRDIRVYGDTAVIFLNWDDPREISFQSGVRRVTFNNQDSYIFAFGDSYKECLINGFPFSVKLGVPSREIFINDVGYECFFGGAPLHVNLNGMSVSVQLEGPPPQVKIGDVKRTDYVVGKINLIINAKLIVPVFLDAKVQKFVIDGETSTLKFVDALRKVLINDVPFNVEFGGLPKPFTVHGKKHFIRFSVLPKGVRPGFVRIADMEGEDSASPPRDGMIGEDTTVCPMEIGEPLRPDLSKVRQTTGLDSPDNRSNSPSFFQNLLQPGLNNFDVISNVFSTSLTPAPTTGGYQVENIPGIAPSEPKEGAVPTAPLLNPAININELFQKLVASGFVKTDTSKNQEDNSAAPTERKPVKAIEGPVRNGSGPQTKKPAEVNPPAPPQKPAKRSLSEILKPVNFARPETLKIRQMALYVTLYSGMQCSSCGMRFPPEASMLYSQHLDWHFRQNRKGKKNARVASSRKWYYSLADWKNYEEIEDLEEREKNYFDQQQQQAEVAAEDADEEVEIPSVPADPGSTNERCQVCRDTFEQFFNEEKEEWHLKNAIKVDNKTYHPVCYEDYLNAVVEITMDDNKVEERENKEGTNKLIPGLEIVHIDDDEEYDPGDVVLLAESDDSKIPDESSQDDKDPESPRKEEDDDDDDVILNEVAPIKIVVEDDDDDEQLVEDKSNDEPSSIKVKKEKPVDDDGFVDVGEGMVSLNKGGQIKIKSEPIDDDEITPTDANRISISEAPSEPPTPVLEKSQPEVVTSHHELITSIDGNIDIVSSSPALVPTTISSGGKIKINISKPLPVIPPKENSDSSVQNESQTSLNPNQPYPPGEEPEINYYKPGLHNVPLKKLPPVRKGTELTGLCSIM